MYKGVKSVRKNDGRKITRDKENPIDNILIDFATLVNPYLHSVGVTPNMLTFGSFAFGLITVAFIYNNMFEVAVLCYLIGYTFDCMDGNMARMFNEITDFGDKFDHYTDTVQIILLIVFVLINSTISKRAKIVFLVVFIVFSPLAAIHIGCQERAYNNKTNDFLSVFNQFCTNKESIYYTRYFGIGTLNIAIASVLLAARFI